MVGMRPSIGRNTSSFSFLSTPRSCGFGRRMWWSSGGLFQGGEPAFVFCAVDADVSVGEFDAAGSASFGAPFVEGGAGDAEVGADVGDGESGAGGMAGTEGGGLVDVGAHGRGPP